MLPGEKNLTPSMGLVITSTPGTLDNTIAATVTIEHSQLATISIEADTGTNNSVQEVAVNATTGTFTLSYNGAHHRCARLRRAVRHGRGRAPPVHPGVRLLGRRDRRAERQRLPGHDPPSVDDAAHLGHDDSGLGPHTPGQLVNETILITQGPAKNKTRIVTGAIADGANWVLTLDKPWFSPFTQDASTPTSDSQYTLIRRTRTCSSSEQTQANLLFLYDTDNPASFNDPAYLAAHGLSSENPFGAGQIFYDPNPFGPKNESGIVSPLNQFRITGFGMGGNRCIGGPATADQRLERGGERVQRAGGCERARRDHVPADHRPPARARRGNNHVTVDTFTNVPDGTRAPQTQIDTGGGNDVVDVKGITGHTLVNLGAGNDTLNVHNDAQKLTELAALLTASGDSPQANVINYANGSARQGTSVDPVDAIQILTVQATGGSYSLTLNGHTTSAIDWNAPATADVQRASRRRSARSAAASRTSTSRRPAAPTGSTSRARSAARSCRCSSRIRPASRTARARRTSSTSATQARRRTTLRC